MKSDIRRIPMTQGNSVNTSIAKAEQLSTGLIREKRFFIICFVVGIFGLLTPMLMWILDFLSNIELLLLLSAEAMTVSVITGMLTDSITDAAAVVSVITIAGAVVVISGFSPLLTVVFVIAIVMVFGVAAATIWDKQISVNLII